MRPFTVKIIDGMPFSVDKCVPTQVESTPEGLRKVTFENVETKQVSFEYFETVVFAIGREPVT